MSLLLLVSLLAPMRGVTIAPHYEGERTQAVLDQMVDEISALGASHLQVVVQWGQDNVHSTEIGPYRWGTNDAEVRRVVAHAHARGLAVLLFPILRVAELGPGRWRGRLDPIDRGAWWAAYRRFVLHYAELAAETGAELLSVGSELGSMETDEAQWRALVTDVRGRYRGALVYSANWDHFPHVRFWDALDYAGVNAYHPITSRDDATPGQLKAAWRLVRDKMLVWIAFAGRPLLFTEVGYPSIVGGARRPYDHGARGAVDLEAQLHAYAAFCEAWKDQPGLAGAFFWIWSGEGGVGDNRYTPRGKPAEKVLAAWIDATTEEAR